MSGSLGQVISSVPDRAKRVKRNSVLFAMLSLIGTRKLDCESPTVSLGIMRGYCSELQPGTSDSLSSRSCRTGQTEFRASEIRAFRYLIDFRNVEWGHRIVHREFEHQGGAL